MLHGHDGITGRVHHVDGGPGEIAEVGDGTVRGEQVVPEFAVLAF